MRKHLSALQVDYEAPRNRGIRSLATKESDGNFLASRTIDRHFKAKRE